MNKSELIAAVAAHTGQSPKDVGATLRGLEDVVVASVAKGETVTWTGFVKFEKVRRGARSARNPRTGETVKVKAKNAPKATVLATFKNVLAGNAPAPKLNKPSKKAAAPAKAAKAPTAKKAAPGRKAAAKKK